MFRRNLNKTPAASADQAQARPSMDNSPQRVAWSDNPDEIDPYSPRGGSATPRQRLTENAVNGQNWLHQQRSEPQEPSTPLQISPYHHQAQQAMIPRANPASPKLQPSPQPPRQSPRFFASSASNQEPMQSQPSASSALSGGSSVGSGRDLPPASFFAEQAHAASGSVFGKTLG